MQNFVVWRETEHTTRISSCGEREELPTYHSNYLVLIYEIIADW